MKPHLVMMYALLIWQWQELQDLQQELEDLSVGSDGVLIWKTGSCGQWLQEAKAKPNLECFSPAFYTHKCGYKLQVSAFLNGKGSGEGTHLSLYVDLLPGAFDNLLEWSFARHVTFCLLDQSDPGLAKPQHVTETFHPGPNWKNFQKPGTWGAPWMRVLWALVIPSSSPTRTSKSEKLCTVWGTGLGVIKGWKQVTPGTVSLLG